eukprot:360116-Chlamydomonas_euryale.AAC.1
MGQLNLGASFSWLSQVSGVDAALCVTGALREPSRRRRADADSDARCQPGAHAPSIRSGRRGGHSGGGRVLVDAAGRAGA